MKLSKFLKQNSSIFSYSDLILLERKATFIELHDMDVPKKEVYCGLIFEVVKCDKRLMHSNAKTLFNKEKSNEIKAYLDRDILGCNIIAGNDYENKKVEIIINDEISMSFKR